jgi:hypothetical protein
MQYEWHWPHFFHHYQLFHGSVIYGLLVLNRMKTHAFKLEVAIQKNPLSLSKRMVLKQKRFHIRLFNSADKIFGKPCIKLVSQHSINQVC